MLGGGFPPFSLLLPGGRAPWASLHSHSLVEKVEEKSTRGAEEVILSDWSIWKELGIHGSLLLALDVFRELHVLSCA